MRCSKCGGLRVTLLPAQKHYTYEIPATTWCMTCGASGMASTQQVEAKTDEPVAVSLRARLAGATQPKRPPTLAERAKGQRGPEIATKTTTKVNWSKEEREALQALIEKHGLRAGCEAYVEAHPSRTILGCQYQWNNRRKW